MDDRANLHAALTTPRARTSYPGVTHAAATPEVMGQLDALVHDVELHPAIAETLTPDMRDRVATRAQTLANRRRAAEQNGT